MQALRCTARRVVISTRLLAAADPACCLANAPETQQAATQQPWGQQRCWSSGDADSQGSVTLTGGTYSAASLVPEAELAVIRQRVFGTHIGNNLSSGRKVRQSASVPIASMLHNPGGHAGAQTAAVWRSGSKLLHEAHSGSPDGRSGFRNVSRNRSSTSSHAPDDTAGDGTCVLLRLALFAAAYSTASAYNTMT